MSQEAPEALENIVHVDCSACGSEMIYSAERELLLCKHCGNTRDLPKESDMVVESDFTECLSFEDVEKGFGMATKTFHCNACGANTAVEPDTVNFACPFCGSDNVNAEAHDQKAIRPAGILPFKIDKKKATEKFSSWIKKGFFAPSDLKRIAKLDKMQGVYVPFWTYDADTRSNWYAEAGYHYYVSETYTDSDGNVKTRQVRRTRWVPASGYYEHHFDDVLVVGSEGIKQKHVEKIYPFDIAETVNYDSRYILGFNSEVYQLDVEKGFGVAETIMDDYIRKECARRVPGDTHRSLRVNTNKSAVTFKHLLLPVWVAGYRYNKKVYQFIVNGQSGKEWGKKPVSFWKVLIPIVATIGIATVLYFIFR